MFLTLQEGGYLMNTNMKIKPCCKLEDGTIMEYVHVMHREVA